MLSDTFNSFAYLYCIRTRGALLVTVLLAMPAIVSCGSGEQVEPGVKGMDSWQEFKTVRPTEPKTLRVTCALGDYYNYQFFGEQDTFYSISLDAPSVDNLSLYAYVRRDTEDGKKMFEKLKDGDSHKMTIKARYLDYGYRGSNTLLIESFVSEGWKKVGSI